MPLVHSNRFAVACDSLVKVFVRHILVCAQGVGVRRGWAELDGAGEELEGSLVLLLQRKAVANNHPGLCSQAVELHGFLGQEGQLHLFFEVPQSCRVVLHPIQAVPPCFACHLEGCTCSVVVHLLEVAPSQTHLRPPGRKVSLRQLQHDLHGFCTPEAAALLVGQAELLQHTTVLVALLLYSIHVHTLAHIGTAAAVVASPRRCPLSFLLPSVSACRPAGSTGLRLCVATAVGVAVGAGVVVAAAVFVSRS
mmetsp:Transcript_164/g.354  ORF Transcript_164/g.354 Transcript_164/m.354 type:complete len:251 (-) Transcript_164:1222-1974(-)